jgi:hypothetical protein
MFEITGGSLTPVIVTVTVADAVAKPSEMVYPKLSVAVWPAARELNWPFGS